MRGQEHGNGFQVHMHPSSCIHLQGLFYKHHAHNEPCMEAAPTSITLHCTNFLIDMEAHTFIWAMIAVAVTLRFERYTPVACGET